MTKLAAMGERRWAMGWEEWLPFMLILDATVETVTHQIRLLINSWLACTLPEDDWKQKTLGRR
jgi:hypothetical protein